MHLMAINKQKRKLRYQLTLNVGSGFEYLLCFFLKIIVFFMNSSCCFLIFFKCLDYTVIFVHFDHWQRYCFVFFLLIQIKREIRLSLNATLNVCVCSVSNLNKNELWICTFFRLADGQAKPFTATWWRCQCTPACISSGQPLATATEFRRIIVYGWVVGDFFLFIVFLQCLQITSDNDTVAYT